jgi:hypothetical protein
MNREPIKTDSDDFSGDLAEVWRTAQQRRAEDIGAWLGQLFERRRRLKVADDGGNISQRPSGARFSQSITALARNSKAV